MNTKSNCQHCNEEIEFFSADAGRFEECPHCHGLTILLLPKFPEPPAEVEKPKPSEWDIAPSKGTKLLLAAVLAITCVCGAFAIYNYREKSQFEKLVGPMRTDFAVTNRAPKDSQKANILSQLEKDLAEEKRRTEEQYNSVDARTDRELALKLQKIKADRELLELQKRNELSGRR